MGVTRQQVLDPAGGNPAELVPASVLMEALAGRHPLCLPSHRDREVTALRDFSTLTLDLHALSLLEKTPRLPIDIGHLASLCRQHTHLITMGEKWTYKFFYLEILAREKKLVPLFWGDVAVLPMDPACVEWMRQGTAVTEAAERRREACTARWTEMADEWLRTGAIAAEDGTPWLERLADVPLGTQGRRDAQQGLLSRCLRFRMQPYYHVHDAMDELLHHMRLEVWQSSIFCPDPITPQNIKKWREQRRRFAMSHRERTDQWERKQRFERFVKEQYHKKAEPAAIVRKVLERRLWPYGTPRGGDPDPAARINACSTAVYRVIREIARGRL